MAYLMWLREPAAVVALMWVSLTDSNVLSPKSDTCRRTPAARGYAQSHPHRANEVHRYVELVFNVVVLSPLPQNY